MSRFSVLASLAGMPLGSSSSSSSSSPPPVHVLRLSSIDQASKRSYLRYCLVFPVSTDDFHAVPERLNATVKRTITNLPILAGTVRPVSGDVSNRVEVSVTAEQVANFKPTIELLHIPQFGLSFQALTSAGAPAGHFINKHLTPLPDAATNPTPVFAVQANFIAGGVIVALYLHHSVCDFVGLQTVVHHLSADLPSVNATDRAIDAGVVEQSRLRDRLSGARGARALLSATIGASPEILDINIPGSMEDGTRVLFFNLAIIEELQNTMNERFSEIYQDNTVHLSMFEVLSALLWRAVSRAITQRVNITPADEWHPKSSLAMPVNIRQRIAPSLASDYPGNAIFHYVVEEEEPYRLALPYDVSRMVETATSISRGLESVNEDRVRRGIASINGTFNVQNSNAKPFVATDDNHLTIIDQTHMLLEGAHLGLELGNPYWARKLGRDVSASQCTVHPMDKANSFWEVTVELEEQVLAAMLRDEGLMRFVCRTA